MSTLLAVHMTHGLSLYKMNTCSYILSSLLDVMYFNMFEGGLPHDAMHDIYEE